MMKSFDEVDIIIFIAILIPSVLLAFFSLTFLKKIVQLHKFSEVVAADLEMDFRYVRGLIVDGGVYAKLASTYIIFGIFIYLIQDSYSFYSNNFSYASIVVFFLVNFLFYKNEVLIDADDAAEIALKILKEISSAKRVGRLNIVESLSKIGDYLIAKFNLNQTGDGFESKNYVSDIDQLKSHERLEYQARTFLQRFKFAIAAALPIVLLILLSAFVRQLF
jgi:hypothetical protein